VFDLGFGNDDTSTFFKDDIKIGMRCDVHGLVIFVLVKRSFVGNRVR